MKVTVSLSFHCFHFHCNELFSLTIGPPVSDKIKLCVIAIRLDILSGDDVNMCNVLDR